MKNDTGRQILAVVRLELRKTFFGRRGLWVYLLALAPALLYLGHSIYAPRWQQRLARLAAAHPISSQALGDIRRGASREEVLKTLGQPYFQHTWRHRMDRRGVREHVLYKYTDGRSDYHFFFVDGTLRFRRRDDAETLSQVSAVFATIFQFYYLRLAVFFGCVGIFMNLFRGEMLDKSLHFYLLTPVRREVLVAGKYLAGLLATVVIFTASTALQLAAMLWEFDHGAVAAYLAGPGWGAVGSYLGVTALACAGYGSIFMAAGLIFRNPIVPTAAVLVWESANVFLPATLKHLSLIFYLQSLCPVAATPGRGMPPLIMALISAANPPTTGVAIATITLFTLLVVAVSGLRARSLEIHYSTD
jgi:ABC-type transport system involved in multi-copper enzyme maturation permease subunit